MAKKIDITVHPTMWEPMKYNTVPQNFTKEERRDKIDMLLASGRYIFSEKYDGDLARVIWDDGEVFAQSRTVSKKTGEYGALEGKLVFIDNIRNAFSGLTVLLGEVYLPGGTAQEVGTILRCLDDKALARQKNDATTVQYYIFDVLCYNGVYLTDKPITERIQYLEEIADKINSPYVKAAKYYDAKPEDFWVQLDSILNRGGEGVVMYEKTMLPVQGRTSTWVTVKVKRELAVDADCFITGVYPPEKEYTGKEIDNWPYWETYRGELVKGAYHMDYLRDGTYIPVTKNYFYNLPGSIQCAVYDKNGNEYPICCCSNLTDDLRVDLRDNFDKYDHAVVMVSGMMITKDKNNFYSIRHPKLMSFRDNYDIKDCTLDKIVSE